MITVQLLLNLSLTRSLYCLKVDNGCFVQVVELTLVPVCFSITKVLLLLRSINNWDIILNVLQRKVQLEVIRLILTCGRHWIGWIVKRSKSLMHGLRRWTKWFQAREPFLLLICIRVGSCSSCGRGKDGATMCFGVNRLSSLTARIADVNAVSLIKGRLEMISSWCAI